MHHAVSFLLFLFSWGVCFGPMSEMEAGVVILGSRTSDGGTAPQSLYSLGLLKRFSVVPRMTEMLAPAPRMLVPSSQVIRHKPHLSCSVLEWRPECSYMQEGPRAVAAPLFHRRHSLCPAVPFCLHWAAWWSFQAFDRCVSIPGVCKELAYPVP